MATWPGSEDMPPIPAQLRQAYLSRCDQQAHMRADLDLLSRVIWPMSVWLANKPRPFVLGISGAQGSGKTTLARLLRFMLDKGLGCRVIDFSLDDFYLTRAQRQNLAVEVHPLLATRGVPGTHDTGLARHTIERLCHARRGETVTIPRFDKAQDDRSPIAQWSTAQAPLDVIIFEGWCLGAPARAPHSLTEATNTLEAEADPQGVWRRYVNQQLAGDYQQLFGLCHTLLYLKVPDMASVLQWRTQQEQAIKGNKVMDAAAVRRFVAHFEALTRHMWETMPERAQFTFYLDEAHQITRVTSRE